MYENMESIHNKHGARSRYENVKECYKQQFMSPTTRSLILIRCLSGVLGSAVNSVIKYDKHEKGNHMNFIFSRTAV